MIKKFGAAAMAAMMFMTILTGCSKTTVNKKAEIKTLPGSDSDNKVFDDVVNLSYEEVINDNGYMEFVFNSFKGCSSDGEDENVMISPASLLFALEMAGAGANGTTLDEMSNVLVPGAGNEEALGFAIDYYKNMSKSDSINVANGAFINDKFSAALYEDYLNYVTDGFDAELNVVPFDDNTVNDINSWVDDKTNGMIPKLVSQLNPETKMVLLNAIAFENKWAEEYEDYQVQEDKKFTNSKGEKEDCTLLYSAEGVYFETDKATGFMKYYEGEEYAFVAVLPKDTSANANDFMQDFSADDYMNFINSRSDVNVYAYIPEFSYDYTREDMADVLKDMGMTHAFEEGGADFSNMCDIDMYISKVIHKTHIEVDREGTKAAAATAVYMDAACAEPDEPVEIKEVRLDRPFAYMIVDTETDTPVFIGTVNSVA